MKDSFVKNLEVFSGAADPAEARIYAVAGDKASGYEDNGWQLSGQLVGPQCDFAHTLPARIPFRAKRSSTGVLAEAIVPDPCFWTPELPFLYRAELNLHHGEEAASRRTQTIGIRRFGNRGRVFFFDAKRFVLRGVNANFNDESLSESVLEYARETWTAAVVTWPTPRLCELASRRGMMLIADLRTSAMRSEQDAVESLRSIAHWPAVLAAIVDAKTTPLIESRGAVRNLMIGQYVDCRQPAAVADTSQIVFAEVTDPRNFAAWAATFDRPVVAVRKLAQPAKIEEQRAACDALQRDLAPFGDFAGYMV